MPRRTVKADLLFILLAASILSLPQLIGKGMIIGSDSIFHFNRFYDTAMQISEGNFQYFISMYGFQGSGRIVNALYGPITAYLHGLLVLLAVSWYKYQLLSNFLLFLLSGISMYFFLKKGEIISQLRLSVSIIYMTTYAVHYWTIRQGFSSWGAALLPFCLLPFIEMVTENKINKLLLAVCMAVMVQTHLFSSLLLVLIYIPAFIYAFFQTDNRKQLLLDLCLSVILFFALTANIWFGFFEIYGRNEILAPFVNQTMSMNTINSNSYYWLLNPIILVFILLFELVQGIRGWKKNIALHKVTLGIGTVFLILSTNLVPWTTLVNHGNPLAELIQFPFRFFIPSTVLFLFSFCMTLQKGHSKYLKVAVTASVMQMIVLISLSMHQWHQNEHFLLSGSHTSVRTNNEEELKSSFFDADLSQSVKLVEKSTPDYLLIYSLDEGNNYELYKKEIINRNPFFTKAIVNNKLTLSWEGESSKVIQVPLIKYSGTELVLNGQGLKETSLSKIGTVSLLQEEGKNLLVASYVHPASITYAWLFTAFSWIGLLFISLMKKIRI